MHLDQLTLGSSLRQGRRVDTHRNGGLDTSQDPMRSVLGDSTVKDLCAIYPCLIGRIEIVLAQLYDIFFVSPSLRSLGSWFGVACFDDRDFKTGSPTNNSWCGCTSRLNLKATLSCHVRRSLVGKNRVVGRHVLRRDGVRIVPAAGF